MANQILAVQMQSYKEVATLFDGETLIAAIKNIQYRANESHENKRIVLAFIAVYEKRFGSKWPAPLS